MENVIKRVVDLFEKLILPIALIIAFLIYQKFSSFFEGNKKEKEQEEKELAQHDDALTPDYKKAKAGASEAEKKKVIFDNEAKAKLFKQAAAAEKLRPLLEWSSMNFTRVDDMFEVAQYMKNHKISISGTAAQFKKLTTKDLYAEARYTLGTKYAGWLQIAGTVK
jgi:uncharacterized protein YpmB